MLSKPGITSDGNKFLSNSDGRASSVVRFAPISLEEGFAGKLLTMVKAVLLEPTDDPERGVGLEQSMPDSIRTEWPSRERSARSLERGDLLIA